MKTRLTVLPHFSVIFRSRARRGADRPAGDRTPALLAGTKAPRHCLMPSAETTSPVPRGTEWSTMATATLQKLVRDPRSGEVHLPHERVQLLGVVRNLDRILLRVKWREAVIAYCFLTISRTRTALPNVRK
jgi:hypothetical protein